MISHTRRQTPGDSTVGPPQSDKQGPIKRAPLHSPGATGPELIQAILAEPSHLTLDEVLRRNPKAQPLSDSELDDLVRVLRAERTAIDVKQEKAKAKKQGVNDDEEVQDT